MKNILYPLLHDALAQIADLSLVRNANAKISPDSAGRYATVEHSQKFTREQRDILRDRGIGTANNETEDYFPNNELKKDYEEKIAISMFLVDIFTANGRSCFTIKLLGVSLNRLGFQCGFCQKLC